MHDRYDNERRAVLTGIGLLTPLGNEASVYFDSLCAGRSGIRRIRKFDPARFPVQIGGELDLANETVFSDEERLEMPPAAQWTVIAARKALADASMDLAARDPYEIDVILGVSLPPIEAIVNDALGESGEWCNAKRTAAVLANPAASAIQLSRILGIRGEIANFCTGCCSSAAAIGHAVRLIKSGESECVLAGGADEGVSPLFFGSFGSSLSQRVHDPAAASRPFDRGRDGAVFSDAACILVIESLAAARKRGARIYCEIAGYGSATHAISAFKHSPSEEPGARAVEKALRQGETEPGDVDYYCALGISHAWLDIRETRMVKRVFGERAKAIPISSIKSMIGHPLGASGALQTAASALAIARGRIPPTINYDDPDPECDLDYVPNRARDSRVRNAVVYSLGQGGINCALLLKAC